jgi:hypothetical protein
VPPSSLPRPEDLGGSLPNLEVQHWTQPLYRIQETDKLGYGRYPKPRYRFDAPAGEYAALYANDVDVATFNECYAERRRRIEQEHGDWHLVRISPGRDLPIVNLKDDRTLSALGLDARISVGDDYETCQAWACAFYDNWPEVCGIAYAARWGGVHTTNVALFPKRCHEDLTLHSLGRLNDPQLEDKVLEAADRYNLTVAFLV